MTPHRMKNVSQTQFMYTYIFKQIFHVCMHTCTCTAHVNECMHTMIRITCKSKKDGLHAHLLKAIIINEVRTMAMNECTEGQTILETERDSSIKDWSKQKLDNMHSKTMKLNMLHFLPIFLRVQCTLLHSHNNYS